MRRIIVVSVAAGMLVAMAGLVPVAASPDHKNTHEYVECFTSLDPEPDRLWFSGKDGANWHVRGAHNEAVALVWVDEAWAVVGTNSTVANWNARWMMTVGGPVPVEGTLWGTFDLELDGVGAFAGSWTWADWPESLGTGSGKGVGDSAGMLVKVTLTHAAAGPCDNPGLVVLEVFDTRH